VVVLQFGGRPAGGGIVVVGEHGGGGSQRVGAGECVALSGSGCGGDEVLDEVVGTRAQAVHCLRAGDAGPVQFVDLGCHGVGDYLGRYGVVAARGWCRGVRHGPSLVSWWWPVTWPALRAGLHHIENNGGDPRAELAAAAASRPLRGADSAARVLRWRLATRSAEQDRANGTAVVPAGTRDRDAGSVLRALAEDPVGTAAAYADAEAHRDTHPEAALAWDEALRAENIDPQRVREDAAAHRDAASTDRPGTDRDLDTGGDSSRDGFAEDYLSALARVGVDPDTVRAQLREGDNAAERPAAEQSPAPPRTMFSDGADAARRAGLSHPRSVAEQLATRTPGGQDTPAARGREHDPIRHRDRSR